MATGVGEQHDEWQVNRCYFSAQSLAKLEQDPEDTQMAALAAY